MATRTMDYLLDTTASTKRNPAKASGKTGEPTENLASVTIVNPMPVDAELVVRLSRNVRSKLEAARLGWVSYSDTGVDILAGDLITVSGVFTDAEVIAAAPWPTDNAYQELIISE